MVARRVWSAEERRLVKWCYEWTPTAELAELLDSTVDQVYRLAHRMGLRKDPSVIRDMARQQMQRPDHPGRRHQFQKGLVPANKGVKRPGWAPGRMSETQFQKGQKGSNYMPIGATRKIDGYLYRKISDVPKVAYTVNWKPVHVLLWERKRGPVPSGHALVFRDGNRDRILISNLELVTRAELMRRNTVHNLPPQLVEVSQLRGALNRKLRRYSRGEK